MQAVVTAPDGSQLLHDLQDIGVDLDEETLEAGDYTTVAGLVLAHLGHIPTAAGETVHLPGFIAEVAEVTGRAITRVRLRPVPTAGEDENEAAVVSTVDAAATTMI
ncbi:transporter associated domain-containing protein [Micromonospora sp. NPDC005220]|uniref:transporter associated domain-containing protein n=1 Tax=Micromonospora sp. NPDC005220 TaxID=3155589 RepID=UPI0033ABA3D1